LVSPALAFDGPDSVYWALMAWAVKKPKTKTNIHLNVFIELGVMIGFVMALAFG
jgi:hypothetical protein